MTKDIKTYIYQINNLVNGKQYIGITSGSPEKRWKQHIYASKKGDRVINRAIRKYGQENFDFITFGVFKNRDTACKFEKYFISKLNPNYNETSGGDSSFELSEESRKKMSIAKIGKTGPWAGKKNPHPRNWCGKKRSAETVNKLRLAAIGRKLTKSTKDKLKAIRKKVVMKSIICHTDGMIFRSMTKAAKYYGVCRHLIGMACAGKRDLVDGKKFSFYEGII